MKIKIGIAVIGIFIGFCCGIMFEKLTAKPTTVQEFSVKKYKPKGEGDTNIDMQQENTKKRKE